MYVSTLGLSAGPLHAPATQVKGLFKAQGQQPNLYQSKDTLQSALLVCPFGSLL